MKKVFRIIQITGYTNRNCAAIWYDGEVYTKTSLDPADFDYAENAENALQECNVYIKEKEKSGEWVSGVVYAYIDNIEYEHIAEGEF
jgi:hypothetical protein